MPTPLPIDISGWINNTNGPAKNGHYVSVQAPPSSINISAPSLADGAQLLISTTGAFDFGREKPRLAYRNTGSGYTAGDDVLLGAASEGAYTASAAPGSIPVMGATPDLPYGMAVRVGTEDPASTTSSFNSKLMSVVGDRLEKSVFLHCYQQYPSVNQDNAAPFWPPLGAPGSGSRQIKMIWLAGGETGFWGQTGADTLNGPPLWIGPNEQYDTGGFGMRANSINGSYAAPGGYADPGDPTRLRSTPLIQQTWIKFENEAGSSAGSDGMYRLIDTSITTGPVADYVFNAGGAGNRQYSGDNGHLGYDRFNFPGYIDGGWSIQDNLDYRAGDIYYAVGPGAACRVSITNNSDYDLSTQVTLCTVTSWGRYGITADLVHGVFWADANPLQGQHVHVHLADNTAIYAGQL